MLARLVAEGALEVRGRSSYRVPGAVSVRQPEGVEPWRIHGERDLYDNRWVKLQLWDVEPPGMKSFEHHVVKLHHVAVTAVLDDQDRVLMMWRYRFVPRQFGWELPGGIVDAGEEPADTALREVVVDEDRPLVCLVGASVLKPGAMPAGVEEAYEEVCARIGVDPRPEGWALWNTWSDGDLKVTMVVSAVETTEGLFENWARGRALDPVSPLPSQIALVRQGWIGPTTFSPRGVKRTGLGGRPLS